MSDNITIMSRRSGMEQSTANQMWNRSYEDLLLYGTTGINTTVNNQEDIEIRRVDPRSMYINPIEESNNWSGLTQTNHLYNISNPSTNEDTPKVGEGIRDQISQSSTQYYSQLTRENIEQFIAQLGNTPTNPNEIHWGINSWYNRVDNTKHNRVKICKLNLE